MADPVVGVILVLPVATAYHVCQYLASVVHMVFVNALVIVGYVVVLAVSVGQLVAFVLHVVETLDEMPDSVDHEAAVNVRTLMGRLVKESSIGSLVRQPLMGRFEKESSIGSLVRELLVGSFGRKPLTQVLVGGDTNGIEWMRAVMIVVNDAV